MNQNYTIFDDFFLYVKHIEHQTPVSFLLLTSICYRVHPINVQLMAYTVIMQAKEEHVCDSGSESLDKQEPRDILHCHVERCDQSFAVAATHVTELRKPPYCMTISGQYLF
jgi:hypothetical protein